MGKKSSWAFGKEAIFMPLFSFPCWNVNIRPESHLVSTIKIDGPTRNWNRSIRIDRNTYDLINTVSRVDIIHTTTVKINLLS